MAVDEAFGDAACALRGRALLVVQQPVVGAQRAVEPDRVVEARGEHAIPVGHHRVRTEGGSQGVLVGAVRERARVQHRIVGQLAVGPNPCVATWIAELLGTRAGRQPSVRQSNLYV